MSKRCTNDLPSVFTNSFHQLLQVTGCQLTQYVLQYATQIGNCAKGHASSYLTACNEI